jgi:lipoprotein NlpI
MTLHIHLHRIFLKAGAAAMIVLASISVDIHEATARDDAPKNAYAYIIRGQYRLGRKEYALAIADFTKAIRLDPQSAFGYGKRGVVWNVKKEYDKALADFDKAIGLDPVYSNPYVSRAVLEFVCEKRNVHETVSLLIKNCDPKDEYATYGVLIGVFAARKSGRKDLVERYLDDVVKRTVERNWPYPVVQYLRGKMSEKELISAAAVDGQMTEARCYIGLNLECDGREAEAVEHFRWVERSGDSTYFEYEIALHELKKLEARRK